MPYSSVFIASLPRSFQDVEPDYSNFVAMGGCPSIVALVERHRSRKSNEIRKSEENAMSLQELLDLRGLLLKASAEEEWTDPLTGKPVSPEAVNLYHMNYHHISPATVPKGIVLQGLDKRACEAREVVEQRRLDDDTRLLAAGFVQQASKGADLQVVVTKGQFVCRDSSVPRNVTVNGVSVGEPAKVSYRGSVSYKELISALPLAPAWFTSHWWGEPVLEFIACCETHAKLRQLGTDASYWVCAYANRQHELHAEISENPDETSFRRAMHLATGVLLILDDRAMPFRRIWCCFELHRTMKEEGGKLLDIVTSHEDRPQLLSDGLLPGEETWAKKRREMKFPMQLLSEGMRCCLEQGLASVDIDRIRILNAMQSRHAQSLSDASVLDRLEHAQDKRCYELANAALRARFALAAFPQAVLRGLVQRFDPAKSKLSLPQILAAHQDLKVVSLDLRNIDELTDDTLRGLGNNLPLNIEVLELQCGGCNALSGPGLKAILSGLGGCIREICLNFSACKNLSVGENMFKNRLPSTVTKYRLSLGKCPKIVDATFCAIVRSLPARLSDLLLDFRGCGQLSDASLDCFRKQLPSWSLQRLELHMRDCNQISARELRRTIDNFPFGIRHFEGSFRGTGIGREFASLEEALSWHP